MTKDRLEELRAAQNGETSTLLANSNNDGHLKLEVVSNITRYKVNKKEKEDKNKKSDKVLDDIYTKVKDVKELLEKIEDETISLRRIQSAALHSVFNNDNHFKLEESMRTIKTTSVKARNGLKELEATRISLENKDGPHDRVILRVLSTQIPILRKQYVNAMTAYQDALVSHKEKTENRIKEQLQIVDKDITNEELEKMLDNQDTSVFVGNYMQEAMDTRLKLQDARQRHKELLQLEIAITELHDMFIEMATLVESQGEVIDRIENYVNTGVDSAEKGREEINKYKIYREKVRKKKVFLYVCLGSILLIIILIVATELYFTLKPSK